LGRSPGGTQFEAFTAFKTNIVATSFSLYLLVISCSNDCDLLFVKQKAQHYEAVINLLTSF